MATGSKAGLHWNAQSVSYLPRTLVYLPNSFFNQISTFWSFSSLLITLGHKHYKRDGGRVEEVKIGKPKIWRRVLWIVSFEGVFVVRHTLTQRVRKLFIDYAWHEYWQNCHFSDEKMYYFLQKRGFRYYFSFFKIHNYPTRSIHKLRWHDSWLLPLHWQVITCIA